jgi:hypothetical protein
MKRIIETTDAAGLDALLGEKVLLMCANYFYTGKLVGVNDTCVELSEPHIVYETGAWSEPGYKDVQSLNSPRWFICRAAIESFGLGK